MAVGTFKLPIKAASVTPSVPSWTRPSDWIDISTVNNNEINLLVGDMGTGIAFSVTTASGTYTIDWGDGTINTARVSGTTYQHQYTTGGGQACSLGYTTYKIRIYAASGNITAFTNQRHSYTQNSQYSPILWINIGAQNITSYASLFLSSGALFYNELKKCDIVAFASSSVICSSMFSGCSSLTSVTLPSSWNGVTNTSQMFNGCYSLVSIVLPSSCGSVTNVSYMFQSCYSLVSVTLPSSWGSATNTSYMFQSCYSLVSVTLPSSWGSVTNTSGMFIGCYSLVSVTLPSSWGLVTTTANMFQSCYSLTSVTLPSSWGIVTTTAQMFYICYSLTSVTLPSSWGSVTTTAQMFYVCSSLTSVTLPSSWGSVTTTAQMFINCAALVNVSAMSSWGSVAITDYMFSGCTSLPTLTLPSALGVITSAQYMFDGCYSLKTINNLRYIGNASTDCNMATLLHNCENLQQAIILDSRIGKVDIYGTTYALKATSIRLTNNASTFITGSPHINIPLTSLSAADLQLLFGDIPNGLSGKTIAITGTTGDDTLQSKTSCTSTAGSNVVANAATSGVTAGMEVYGANLSAARAVTFTTGTNLVTTPQAHGMSNGKQVSFATIITTTGIVINTPYYVINVTSTTFQLSLTNGGAAVTLSASGTGTMVVIPVVVSVSTNVSWTLDVAASASGSITMTAGILLRSIAMLKGWTITN